MNFEIIILVILIVLVVALFVVSFMRRRKVNQDLSSMRTDLKKGDKVMTDSGVVGEIVSSYEEEGYKYFVLKSGDAEHVGYLTVHANAIYYVYGKEKAEDKKEKIVIKANTNPQNKEENK